MATYLKEFETHSNYSSFIRSQQYLAPNVSYCVEQKEVHYGQIEHKNIVTYTAYEDLDIGPYGFNVDAFCANYISHEYDQETGKGVLIFDGDVTCALGINDSTGGKLRSITLPSTVSAITISNVGSAVFEELTVKALTPPTFIGSVPENAVIYVPADAVEDYKAATNWSIYANQIQTITQ